MIKKKGKYYLVLDSKGKKILGRRHKTRREALKQLAAIEISKKKRKK